MDEQPVPELAKPRRRRLAISLRGLMLLVLLLAVWLGWRVHRASTQRRAVAAVKAAGGTVFYEYQIPPGSGPVTRVISKASHPVPAWLRGPIGDEYFQEPAVVFFNGGRQAKSKPTDATFEAVATFDRLRWIQSIGAPVSNASFARLAKLTRLDNVILLDADITDDGLGALESFPALEQLSLRVKPGAITAKGFASIARKPRLKLLELIGASLPEASSLAPLANLSGLDNLRLTKSPQDEACVEYLRGKTAMKTLGLNQTRLTDAGLDRLAGMNQLSVLACDGSKLTKAGLLKLQSDHPLLRIVDFTSVPTLTDADLPDVVKIVAFKDLNVTGPGVTDAGLAVVAATTQFRSLGLSGTGVDGSNLGWLAGQPRLDALSLDRTKVGDAAMPMIANALGLGVLRLAETPITDAGLLPLRSIPKLRYLDVRGTKVTEEGVAAFRKARPKVRVDSGPIALDR